MIKSVQVSGNSDTAKRRIIDAIKKEGVEEISLDLESVLICPLPVIWELRSLKELCLKNNKIPSLPIAVGQLTNLKVLDLSYNYFTTLPTEIGLLTNLTTLNLRNNHFISSLPETIGELTRLNKLFLKVNELASLPRAIGLLTQLTELDLGQNKLTSFPAEMWNLTRLNKLFLHHNPLSSLPAGIGQLASLTYLSMDNTNLTFLPTQLGNLLNLTSLIVNDSNITELPLSLGQIPALTNIYIQGTGIAPAIRQAILYSILRQCREMRRHEAVDVLPLRFAKWRAIAGFEDELDINNLSVYQKLTLNEWLHRLELTQDFANFQTSLALTVCNILEDALKNPEFQTLFFSQAEANNACCQDRAAMSLNEIYTSWNILCKSADLSLLTGVAKTLRLRKELQKLIPKEERESVEIFLYYETALRQRLGLVTAIQSMAYGSIGKRDWIDENSLVNNVEANFFDELFELPVFEKMVIEGCRDEWEAINAEFQEQMGERPEGEPNESQVLEYQHRQGEILGECKRRKMDIAKKWYEKLLMLTQGKK